MKKDDGDAMVRRMGLARGPTNQFFSKMYGIDPEGASEGEME